MTLEQLLANMRADGWMVAVHNDYRLDGDLYTFWLFTHAKTGRFVKGEAATDERAVSDAWTMSKIILGLEVIPAESQDGQTPPTSCNVTLKTEEIHPYLCVQHGGSADCERVNRLYGFDCPKCKPYDHFAGAGKKVYDLRPGATAMLVPFANQPSEEFRVSGPCEWIAVTELDEDGEAYAAEEIYGVGDESESYVSPASPGDIIATTQGPRRVVSVRAVDTEQNAIVHEAGWFLYDWQREYPNCRWAWLVEVERDIEPLNAESESPVQSDACRIRELEQQLAAVTAENARLVGVVRQLRAEWQRERIDAEWQQCGCTPAVTELIADDDAETERLVSWGGNVADAADAARKDGE